MRTDTEKERCEVIAEYVIDTGDTVRAAAAHFGISKSTVHNKSERHIRGGEATRKKYQLEREKQKHRKENREV